MIEQSPLNLGFRPLLEAALDATVVVDSLGRVVALNQEVERGEVAFPCFQQLM